MRSTIELLAETRASVSALRKRTDEATRGRSAQGRGTMQRNIYQAESGAWIVEYRFVTDRRWSNMYTGASESAARKLYAMLARQS